MSTSNSDLKSFAVFVNSKSSQYKSSTKSEVSIPFTSNLAYHDPMRVFKLSMVDMLFTNSFYNIRPNVNKLKIYLQFAAGRGVATQVNQTITITVPDGFYSYDTLTSYLNQYCGETLATTITYSTGATTFDLYRGFGGILGAYTDPTLSTIDAVNADAAMAKILFQSPYLGMLYQDKTNLTTVPTVPLTNSYIYKGVYLLMDAETIGLMKTLGFLDTSSYSSVPFIPDSGELRGFGYSLQAVEKVPGAAPASNAVYYNIVSQKGEVFTNTTISGADETYVSIVPNLMTDLSGLDELYVSCSQLRTHFKSSLNQGKLAPSEVIAVIPLNVPYGSKMSWQPPFPLTSFLKNTNITQLDFRITNSNGELLDFHGLDWSITFFCSEEADTSAVEYETSGTVATPYQVVANNMNAGSYMQERRTRRRAELV